MFFHIGTVLNWERFGQSRAHRFDCLAIWQTMKHGCYWWTWWWEVLRRCVWHSRRQKLKTYP